MEQKNPLVSVIIPVYKVEAYLEACLDSVCGQTYENLEVILVDDGSPDGCPAICDRYAAKDSRIRVIHQQNSGVAKARNAGLEVAKGAYLFFADSDDVVDTQAIAMLVSAARVYHAEMVCADCNTIGEAGEILERCASHPPRKMTAREAMTYYAPRDWGPWNKLIRADIHRGIFFPPYKIHEDEAIKFRLLERCETVVQLRQATYGYRQRQGSITAANSAVDKMDMFHSCKENYEYLKGKYPDIAAYFMPCLCNASLYNLDILIRKPGSGEKIRQITDFARAHYTDIRHNPHLTTAQKLRFWLIIRSNWEKEHNLYTRFYSALRSLRGR